MFDALSTKLTDVFNKLRKRGALGEEDVTLALREIRIALLEADVALPVVKDFVDKVKEKAIGQEVLKSITPGQMVVKIVHDHLIELLGQETVPLKLGGNTPHVLFMVGLQGSGKTTSSAKLAKFLKDTLRKKVLLASTDIYRPAAREQLEILGQQIQVESLDIRGDEKPLSIAKRALEKAKLEGFDVLLVDTAGRLHIDDALMGELSELQKILKPQEILLNVDAMIGQDAVKVAQGFQEKLALTGVILSRMDGDARGGAALSMRAMTGCPIKFCGVGERPDQLETFSPDRVAGRILDMGDIVSLVEKASVIASEEDMEALQKKMEKGQFDLDDMAMQLRQISKMGGISSLLGMMPGMGQIKDKIAGAGLDDSLVKRQLAIIQSMTKKERKDSKILNGSRRKRIANGSGTTVAEVNRLLKQYMDMQDVMKRFNKGGKKGFMRHGLRGLLSPK